MTSVGCVVLTTGSRPAELRRALDSLLAQEGVDADIVVVGNGWEPEGLPEGVRGLALAQDRGIPAGRNAGAEEARGELLFFLDDDAAARPGWLRALLAPYADPDVVAVGGVAHPVFPGARPGLLPWVAALPFYWPLGAVAAWRAIAEIFTRPTFWHKTEHGVSGA